MTKLAEVLSPGAILTSTIYNNYQLQSTCPSVDWYTATLPLDTACAASAAEIMIEVLSQHEQEGNRRKERVLNGFQGSMVGGCFIGIRGDLMQVQLSGERAQENWFMVHSSNAHVSRMDVQVTAQWTVMPPHLGYAAREDARRKNAERTEKRRRKIAVHEDDEGGYTLYVGSALSEQFGRLYNKEVESKGVYARSWRFEVVLRNSHATEMARYLALHSHQMTRMETFVADWFAERGIAVPWERGEYTVPRMAPAREKPESEKALQWLMTQVAPTVRWLHNHYDRATLEKALMLGVEPLAYSTGQEGGDEYAEPDS